MRKALKSVFYHWQTSIKLTAAAEMQFLKRKRIMAYLPTHTKENRLKMQPLMMKFSLFHFVCFFATAPPNKTCEWWRTTTSVPRWNFPTEGSHIVRSADSKSRKAFVGSTSAETSSHKKKTLFGTLQNNKKNVANLRGCVCFFSSRTTKVVPFLAV